MTGTEWRTHRPHHPVVAALEADRTGAAFIEYMRSLLVPGPWEVPTGTGFSWFPYRLMHTVEILDLSTELQQRIVCRSLFVLGEGFDFHGNGSSLANYLNQRPLGAGVFCHGDGRIIAASSAALEPSEWWNAYLFANSVVRQVGIWENIMPRAWAAYEGSPPAAVHPTLGSRHEPDQFVHEHLRILTEPEAATGIWFSEPELRTFRAKTQEFAELNGLTDDARRIADVELDEALTSASNLEEFLRFDVAGQEALVRVTQSDHPDLGRGLETFGATSVRVKGGQQDPSQPASSGFQALMAVSVMNAYQADFCPAALNLGGWTSWRGQLMRTRFIDGETMRSLLTVNPTVDPASAGVILSLLFTDETASWSTFGWMMAEGFLADQPELWERTSELEWGGIEENAGLMPLLVPNGIISRAGLDEVPCNQLLEDPVILEGADAWYQHRSTIAQWGIFSPSGPSVGTLEVSIDYEAQRGLLIERRRHPQAPLTLVHAVLDREGFDARAGLAGQVVAQLEWSPPDWFEIIHDSCRDELINALAWFISNSGQDPALLWRKLLHDIDDPWMRLRRDEVPPGEPVGAEQDLYNWLTVLTSARNVDNHVAMLRSAWEGSQFFARGDVESAQSIAERLNREVYERRGR